MTNKETRARLQACIDNNFVCGGCEFEVTCDIEKVHELAIEALEKQIPQKPYKVGVRDYECPKCHKFLHVVGYPCRCGQAISWEGEE